MRGDEVVGQWKVGLNDISGFLESAFGKWDWEDSFPDLYMTIYSKD